MSGAAPTAEDLWDPLSGRPPLGSSVCASSHGISASPAASRVSSDACGADSLASSTCEARPLSPGAYFLWWVECMEMLRWLPGFSVNCSGKFPNFTSRRVTCVLSKVAQLVSLVYSPWMYSCRSHWMLFLSHPVKAVLVVKVFHLYFERTFFALIYPSLTKCTHFRTGAHIEKNATNNFGSAQWAASPRRLPMYLTAHFLLDFPNFKVL